MRLFFRPILRFLSEADVLLLVLCLLSSIYGIILVASSTAALPPGNYVNVQIGAVVIGVALFVLLTYVDIDIIADKSGLLFVVSLFFISTLFIWGYGDEIGTRVAWLRFWGIGIQPAEVVKVPFIIIISSMLAAYKERKNLNTFVSIIKLGAVSAMVLGAILLASDDFGSALMYFFILLAMLFVGGVRLRWFLIGGAAFAAISPLIWYNVLDQKHRNRLMAPFFQELVDPTRQDVLWQPDMSVRAIASGGFYGQGLGNGTITQSVSLPSQHTDFIFSAAGEDLGFIGCILIMLLLTAIIIRCVYVGIKSNNSLGMLVCIGFAAMFISQTIVNIGMCLGILPVIGVTLPFFSYGGSSIVTFFAAAGIVSGVKMRPKPLRFRTM